MENIIKIAIEGGWKPFGSIKTDGKEWGVPEVYANFYHQPTWLLDPLFWQALGKKCGWEMDDIDIPLDLPDLEREALEYKAEQRGCNIPDGSEVTLSQLWIKNNPNDKKIGRFTKIKGNHGTGYIHILKEGNKLPSQYWAGFWVEKKNWKDNALRFHEINLTEGWEAAVAYLGEVTRHPTK